MPRGKPAAKVAAPIESENIGFPPDVPTVTMKVPLNPVDRMIVLEHRVELLLAYAKYNTQFGKQQFERWLVQERGGEKW